MVGDVSRPPRGRNNSPLISTPAQPPLYCRLPLWHAANHFKQLAMLVIARHMDPSEVEVCRSAGTARLSMHSMAQHSMLCCAPHASFAQPLWPQLGTKPAAPLPSARACAGSSTVPSPCLPLLRLLSFGLNCSASSTPPSCCQGLRELFYRLDEEGTGTINADQLKEALAHLGKTVSSRAGGCKAVLGWGWAGSVGFRGQG